MPTSKSLWITYAWDDNKDKDVDYLAQELSKEGLDIKLDRWNLTAGKRLWEQIESFIKEPAKSDGWLLYATQNSIGNQKCKEEYYYALNRALETRGEEFPVIALFNSTVDYSLIPSGIKTRLYVSIVDPDWKERIVASIEGRDVTIGRPRIEPYVIEIHEPKSVGERYAIEVRPRGGTWSPFFAAIPLDEKQNVSLQILHGPSKCLPNGGMLSLYKEGETADHKYWLVGAINEATPTQSYYIFCKKLPSILIFGVEGSTPQYQVQF